MRGTRNIDADFSEILSRSDKILQAAILARQALVLASPEFVEDADRLGRILARAAEIYSQISLDSLELGEDLALFAETP